MPRTPAELPDPREDLWASLVALLRLLRRLNGMSQEQTAEICGVERQTVGAWESGRNRIGRDHCKKLDTAWKTGAVLEAQHHFASTYEGSSALGDYLADEQAARVARIYTNNVIPAPFQTTDYARGLFTARSIQNVEDELKKWLTRQTLLTRADPPNISAIINQAAFDYQPARDVMVGQVDRLIEIGRLPNVAIRIIPKPRDWYIGLDGDVSIFSVNGTRRTYISGQLGTRAITGGTSADRLEARWEKISEVALPSDKSINLLHVIKKDLTRD